MHFKASQKDIAEEIIMLQMWELAQTHSFSVRCCPSTLKTIINSKKTLCEHLLIPWGCSVEHSSDF